MGIKKPFVSEIAKDTYAINEFGLTAMYLIIGEEKALLLDTGCGVCDLKELVSELTDKPVMVALTHGHLDHAGGIGAFDEIWLGEEDFEMAKNCNFDALKNYADNLGKQGSYDVYDYSLDMIDKHAFTTPPVMHPLKDGDVIDLGGRQLLVIHIPGHTPGGMCFLEDATRILFSGDACNTNLLGAGTSVTETYNALKYLDTFTGRYDQMWNGHVGYTGAPYCQSQPKTTLPDLLHICETILDGTAQPIEFDFLGRKMCAVEYGVSRLFYNIENQ